VDEHLDVRRQLEMQRRHFELDMVQRRARMRRLRALGILLMVIAMAFLVSVIAWLPRVWLGGHGQSFFWND
jgi:hypothetical protein